MDSAASESEVTMPGFSFLGSLRVAGSVVTFAYVSHVHCEAVVLLATFCPLDEDMIAVVISIWLGLVNCSVLL